MWEDFSSTVGFWADMENPYVTYDDNYIESEWWALKEIWNKGLLYKGFKIVPYCPRCCTAHSSHEVAQGYKDVKETSAIAKFKMEGTENTYILAWTTTPWTLPSNVILSVNANETYVKAKYQDYYVIMAEALLDSVLGEERIQGYIPAGTRREALQQLAFAIGAVVDCSRGEIIRIVPAPQRASGLIGTDRRLQDGSKVTLLTLVTAVSVTAHRYIPGEASEELYKDTLEPGTYRVTFDAPAVADSLAVRGAELSERGVNHCTLTVSKAAEVCVTGRKYSDSATVLRREASNLPSNAQGNEVSVPDATLVSPDRAAAVAARVLDYYAQRYEQTFRMVAGDEKLADRLIVESFGGEMVRGVVTKLEFDLTGGFLADAKIVGRKLSNNAAAYAGEEIHAGERSFI